MALNIEVAELMKQPGRVYEVAEKTQYNRAMDAEDKCCKICRCITHFDSCHLWRVVRNADERKAQEWCG